MTLQHPILTVLAVASIFAVPWAMAALEEAGWFPYMKARA